MRLLTVMMIVLNVIGTEGRLSNCVVDRDLLIAVTDVTGMCVCGKVLILSVAPVH